MDQILWIFLMLTACYVVPNQYLNPLWSPCILPMLIWNKSEDEELGTSPLPSLAAHAWEEDGWLGERWIRTKPMSLVGWTCLQKGQSPLGWWAVKLRHAVSRQERTQTGLIICWLLYSGQLWEYKKAPFGGTRRLISTLTMRKKALLISYSFIKVIQYKLTEFQNKICFVLLCCWELLKQRHDVVLSLSKNCSGNGKLTANSGQFEANLLNPFLPRTKPFTFHESPPHFQTNATGRHINSNPVTSSLFV